MGATEADSSPTRPEPRQRGLLRLAGALLLVALAGAAVATVLLPSLSFVSLTNCSHREARGAWTRVLTVVGGVHDPCSWQRPTGRSGTSC